MSEGTFLFEKPVGILPKKKAEEVEDFRPSVQVRIELVQNGFKLHYEDKEFIEPNLDAAIDRSKKWLKDQFEKAKKNDSK
jgi:hypothetical protein